MLWGPGFILDDKLSQNWYGYWHSYHDYDWVEIDFGTRVEVMVVVIVFRLDSTDQRYKWKNIEV